jgi:hypothetical protein
VQRDAEREPAWVGRIAHAQAMLLAGQAATKPRYAAIAASRRGIAQLAAIAGTGTTVASLADARATARAAP